MGKRALSCYNTENLTVDHSVRVTCLESVVRGRRFSFRFFFDALGIVESTSVYRSPRCVSVWSVGY
jgi:predicted PhzF superfamily epimerase YddE/YHI9